MVYMLYMLYSMRRDAPGHWVVVVIPVISSSEVRGAIQT